MLEIMYAITMGFLLVSSSYALQVKAMKDNQSESVKISSKELSRLFVLGDRVQAIRGLNGAYELIKDEKQGAIFIKPTPYYINKPFNLFITTENGHTFNLLLFPLDIPAESIEIKPLSPSVHIAERWEKNAPYVETLIRLITNMVNDQQPEGYSVVPVHGDLVKYPKFSMTLETIYKGDHLEGETWSVKNTTKTSIYLKSSHFMHDNTRAISIEDDVLDRGEVTYVYRVNNNG
jgi:conjugal transfer pilus assembly protein TraK